MLRYKVGFAVLVALAASCVGVIAVLVRDPRLAAGRAGDARPQSGPASTTATRTPAASKVQRHDRPGGIPANAELANVSRLVDGDTLRITAPSTSPTLVGGDETVVRLLEIDTPESVDPNSPLQCYANRASEHLRRLTPVGSRVWVAPDKDLLDPYGRTLLYMWNSAGTFVNLEMVRSGFAKAVLYEPNDLHINLMRRAERRARAAQRGLWGACDYFGQPVGFAATNPTSGPTLPTAKGTSLDPRFPYCSDANDAGFGNYVRGRDEEYEWYDDADGDGVVCEF